MSKVVEWIFSGVCLLGLRVRFGDLFFGFGGVGLVFAIIFMRIRRVGVYGEVVCLCRLVLYFRILVNCILF